MATIGVTITAVNAADRSITVSRKSKTTTFDASRKAQVSIEGKPAKLDSLKPGQKASFTFKTEFDVVVKLEAAGGGSSAEQKN